MWCLCSGHSIALPEWSTIVVPRLLPNTRQCALPAAASWETGLQAPLCSPELMATQVCSWDMVQARVMHGSKLQHTVLWALCLHFESSSSEQ